MPDQDLQRQSRDSEAILRDYISRSRQAGKTDDQIRQELSGAGWGEEDLDEVLKSNENQPGIFYKFNNRVAGVGVIISWIFFLYLLNAHGDGGFGLAGLMIIFLFFSAAMVIPVIINVVLSIRRFKSLVGADRILFFISMTYFILFFLFFMRPFARNVGI